MISFSLGQLLNVGNKCFGAKLVIGEDTKDLDCSLTMHDVPFIFMMLLYDGQTGPDQCLLNRHDTGVSGVECRVVG